MSDVAIIELARKFDSLILTEDKDFGEWIFAHKLKSSGVIFLRYHFSDLQSISENLINILQKEPFSLSNKFTVISKNKVRMRSL